MSALADLPPHLYTTPPSHPFRPTGGFDIGTARAMIWMSRLAYESSESGTIEFVRPLWRLDRISPFFKQMRGGFANFASRGIVGEGHGAVVIAFGGTDPLVWEN